MRNLTIASVLASLAVLTFCSQAFAQTQDDLFNGDILHEIRLYTAPEDYETYKETNFTCQAQELEVLAGEVISPLPRVICRFPVELHCKFHGADVTVAQAGIDSHAKGSRDQYKPFLKIDFRRCVIRNT